MLCSPTVHIDEVKRLEHAASYRIIVSCSHGHFGIRPSPSPCTAASLTNAAWLTHGAWRENGIVLEQGGHAGCTCCKRSY